MKPIQSIILVLIPILMVLGLTGCNNQATGPKNFLKKTLQLNLMLLNWSISIIRNSESPMSAITLE